MNDIKFDGFVILDKRRFLPKCSGVYFIVSDDRIFYIGKSVDIRSRVVHGHHKFNQFVELSNPSIFWVEAPKDKLSDLERKYIRQFAPPLNDANHFSVRLTPSIGAGYAIKGRFYTSLELQDLLKVSKQRISSLGRQKNWIALSRGLYCAEDVEPYLLSRNIDPQHLPIYTHSHPDGATWAQLEKEFDQNDNQA